MIHILSWNSVQILKTISIKVINSKELILNFFCRNPNYPLQVEELLNTGKEAKRFKMVKWESFDEKKKYLELGTTAYLIHIILSYANSRPKASVEAQFPRTRCIPVAQLGT